MLNKLSGYQKLKKENLELRRKLMVLSFAPNTAEGIGIRKEIELSKDIECAVYAGDVLQSVKFEGMIKQIAQW